MADASLSVELEARVSNFVSGMRQAGTVSQQTAKTVTTSTDKIGSAIRSQLASAFSAAAFISFGKAVLDVTAEFQKFNAVLGNTLGSSTLASLKLKEIQDFAAKTPFGVNELTGAFVKLANSGFKPTGDQMRALGDLASSTGKSFDQLAEAILDAQSGEFERLKEFGVRAKDAGDSVIFTYKGVQTQVAKTSESIRNYITDLGNAEGVSGSMAKISETLGGKISNLGDSWDQMLLSVGGNTEGVFNTAIDIISKAINKVTDYNNELALASKYDLGNGVVDFGQRISSAFFGTGKTDLELQASIIQQISKGINDTANRAITGAKKVSDFGKAIAELKKQGDTQLATATKNGASSGQIKAISDAYQFGVKALQDARTAFGNQSSSDANFGDSKKVKTLSDVLKVLNIDLEKSSNQFKSTFSEENEARISSYQKAIDDLIEIGYNRTSAAVIKLKKEQQGLFLLTGNDSTKGTQEALKRYRDSLKQPELLGNTSVNIPSLENSSRVKEYNQLLAEQAQFKADYEEGFRQLSSGAISDAIGGGFSAIGEAMVSGGSVIEAAGNALLGTLGSFLNELGQMLIKKGLATVLAGTALNFLFPGSGAKTTAGGFGLIAAGAALSLGSGIIGGASRGVNNRNTTNNVTAFASGGIVSGPTNALIGEYAGARNNPEVVAPLSKLKSMIGGGEQIYIAENVIRGQDIVTIYKKASGTLRRVN